MSPFWLIYLNLLFQFVDLADQKNYISSWNASPEGREKRGAHKKNKNVNKKHNRKRKHKQCCKPKVWPFLAIIFTYDHDCPNLIKFRSFEPLTYIAQQNIFIFKLINLVVLKIQLIKFRNIAKMKVSQKCTVFFISNHFTIYLSKQNLFNKLMGLGSRLSLYGWPFSP